MSIQNANTVTLVGTVHSEPEVVKQGGKIYSCVVLVENGKYEPKEIPFKSFGGSWVDNARAGDRVLITGKLDSYKSQAGYLNLSFFATSVDLLSSSGTDGQYAQASAEGEEMDIPF